MQTGFDPRWLPVIMCLTTFPINASIPARAVAVEPLGVAAPSGPAGAAAAPRPKVTVVGPVVVTAS
ncbi:MAG TPA: hypothetical protein VLL75_22320, partial [Vicinamibacteria bacterium]|nr:hypothetical protein [Vicinamibacteria bacterium]